MSTEAATFEQDLIQQQRFTSPRDAMFEIRKMVESRRQFVVGHQLEAGEDAWYVCAPKIGHRNPAAPQPTDPTTVELLAKSA